MVDPAPLSNNTSVSKKDPSVMILIVIILLLLSTLATIIFKGVFNRKSRTSSTVLNQPVVPPPIEITNLLLKYPYNSEKKSGVVYLNGGTLFFIVGDFKNITDSQIVLSINGKEEAFQIPSNIPVWKAAKKIEESVRITPIQLVKGKPVILETNIGKDGTVTIKDIQIPYDGQLNF